MNPISRFLAGGLKGAMLLLLMFFASSPAYAQCDCPPVATCAACQGGLTSLTLRYNNSILPIGALITVTDGGGIIYVGTVNPGSTFSFTSSSAGQPFVNNQITISATVLTTVNISTGCGTPVFVGDVFGNFTVTQGSSMSAKPICCAVEDLETEKPTFSGCPSNITTTLPADACVASVTWTEPVASDNCGITSVTSNFPSGYNFPRGISTVTYTATDHYGNTNTCSFTVTVTDTSLPVIANCPPDVIVNAASNACVATATWTVPTVSDNCSATLTSTHAPGASFPVGTTLVKYTATDLAGNTSECSFNVIVKDVTKPLFTNCPANITVSEAGCTRVATWTAPTVSDACGATLSTSHAPGSSFPIGTTTVTYTATDPSGNSNTCSFSVIVRDFSKPLFTTCNHGQIIEFTADNSCHAVATWTVPVATDNCTVTLTSSHVPGTIFPLGKTDVEYTATDLAGNISTCKFKISVRDITPPVISGCVSSPINLTSTTECGAVATWVAPTATDNCSVTMTSNYTSGNVFPIGTTAVVYTATDGSGNITTCSFNVVVTDLIAPTVSGCPANIIASTSSSSCGAVVSWTPPVFSDLCPVTVTNNFSPGAEFPKGITTVTYTGSDPGGNTKTCSFTVTVNDATNPVITGCPSNITVNADANCKAIVNWVAPTITDNCSVSVTTTHAPGAEFALGTTLVKYTAKDAAGNTSVCSFNVIVLDTTPPQFTQCLDDITVSADPLSCQAAVAWTPPVATDNCSVTLTSNFNPGSLFMVGTTVVSYTAEDGSGNKTQCSFKVIVNDVTPPTISNCPGNIVMDAGSACGAQVSWTVPTFSSTCGSFTSSSTHLPGDFFPVGTTLVRYTVTDLSSNISTCEFNVTVLDRTAPVFVNCPGEIKSSAGNNCKATVSWAEPAIADNCAVTVTATHLSGSEFPIGTTEVIYTAVDASGNQQTCAFSILVEDTTAPFFATRVNDIEVSSSTSACGNEVEWSAPVVDDCSEISVTSSHHSGDFFPVGVTTVTYVAQDQSGNRSEFSFNVKVIDNVPPVIKNLPTEIITYVGSDCQAQATWAQLEAIDNCGQVSILTSHESGSVFPLGKTIVTGTVKDGNGNVSAFEFSVTVQNSAAPVFTSCPADIAVKVSESGKSVVEWTEPTASSQCGALVLTNSHQPGSEFFIGETTVEYIAVDETGLSSTCSFRVVVAYEDLAVRVSKVLTPDGDGINDRWEIEDIEKFRDNKVLVVDRWGSVIFSAQGYNNESVVWNGMNSNGGQIPTGTYFYTVTVKFLGAVLEKKGFIEVIN
jgi:large repetitive protein